MGILNKLYPELQRRIISEINIYSNKEDYQVNFILQNNSFLINDNQISDLIPYYKEDYCYFIKLDDG